MFIISPNMKFLRKYNKLLSQIVTFCFIGGEGVKTTELFEVKMAERMFICTKKVFLSGLDWTDWILLVLLVVLITTKIGNFIHSV